MIYFNSKCLSKKLGINLARWKRWSREFLDPDPLGGFQSGYARQFSNKEAFRVYLGGCLVAQLKFTIPEARQILIDLHSWLKKNDFYTLPTLISRANDRCHHIYIYPSDNGGFGYAIRSESPEVIQKDGYGWQERFELECIGTSAGRIANNEYTHARVIHINTVQDRFLSMLDAN